MVIMGSKDLLPLVSWDFIHGQFPIPSTHFRLVPRASSTTRCQWERAKPVVGVTTEALSMVLQADVTESYRST